jgi:hypothetical protein
VIAFLDERDRHLALGIWPADVQFAVSSEADKLQGRIAKC